METEPNLLDNMIYYIWPFPSSPFLLKPNCPHLRIFSPCYPHCVQPLSTNRFITSFGITLHTITSYHMTLPYITTSSLSQIVPWDLPSHLISHKHVPLHHRISNSVTASQDIPSYATPSLFSHNPKHIRSSSIPFPHIAFHFAKTHTAPLISHVILLPPHSMLPYLIHHILSFVITISRLNKSYQSKSIKVHHSHPITSDQSHHTTHIFLHLTNYFPR